MNEINVGVAPSAKTLASRVMETIDLSRAERVDTVQAPDGIYARHSDFVYCNTGGWAQRKPWAAQITGHDFKYKFAREFLQRTEIDGVTYQKIPELPAVVQFHGGSTKNEYKPFYVIFEKEGKVYALEVNENILIAAITEIMMGEVEA